MSAAVSHELSNAIASADQPWKFLDQGSATIIQRPFRKAPVPFVGGNIKCLDATQTARRV
jgi:hypothetical protein